MCTGESQAPPGLHLDRSIDPCKFGTQLQGACMLVLLFLSCWGLRFAILISSLERTLPNACLYRSIDGSVLACMLCDDEHYLLTVPYAHT